LAAAVVTREADDDAGVSDDQTTEERDLTKVWIRGVKADAHERQAQAERKHDFGNGANAGNANVATNESFVAREFGRAFLG
jgi:hypothetical protein